MLLSAAWLAQASGIAAHDPRIEADGEGYSLSADFDIDLAPRIEDIINRGIELHFVVDFELARGRWYWFDARIAQRSRTYRLSYHALTRQYRLATGGLHQSFVTLGEALRVLARLRNWPVAGKGDLSADTAYQAALRLRLDLSQMPRTFQVSALSNAEWNLDSGWLRWRFQPPAADAVGVPGQDAGLEGAGSVGHADRGGGVGEGGKSPVGADSAEGAVEPAKEPVNALTNDSSLASSANTDADSADADTGAGVDAASPGAPREEAR